LDWGPFRGHDRGFGHVLLIGFGLDGPDLWLSSLLRLVGLLDSSFDLSLPLLEDLNQSVALRMGLNLGAYPGQTHLNLSNSLASHESKQAYQP